MYDYTEPNIPWSFLQLHYSVLILAPDPQHICNAFLRKNSQSNVTLLGCQAVISCPYWLITITKCCHTLAKCGMEVERWEWQGDDQKDVIFLLDDDVQATCLL